jgi:predicted nucleotidyltransferase
MTDTLIDLSGRIDPGRERALRDVASGALALGIPFFLVGAFARDLLLELRYGLKTQRATNDVDFGIRVEGWDEFETLKRALVEIGRYSPDPHQGQRLISEDGALIDIVPFGGVEDAKGNITWPPEYAIVMNALGFEEAFQHAVRVRLTPDLEVRVSSLAGLALMKLIAWDDRRENSDAKDLRFIISNYLQAGNEERVYGNKSEHSDLLDDEKFVSVELTSARLLGRDVGMLLTDQSRQAVIRILEEQTADDGSFALVAAMTGGALDADEAFERALHELKMFMQGISDARQY